MKRFRWVILLPFVLFLQFAFADSVTFNTAAFTYSFGTDFGGGDNAVYDLYGPGISLIGNDAGALCRFCSVGFSFSPGTSLVPDIFVDFGYSVGFVTIGGTTYYGPEEILFYSSITAGGFTFPAGGNTSSTFTVNIPASFPVVQGDVGGTLFNVNVPAGQLVLTFDYHPAANGVPATYIFSQGNYTAGGLTQTPEPGTIGLMAAGLAGMVGLIRRKRDS